MSPAELVQSWIEAFNCGDVEALAGMYAENAVNHQVALDPVVGRAAIRGMFEREFAAAEMVCIVEQILEEGEWAVVEWKDPKRLRGCGFFHVIDGLIVMQRGYWDKLSFHRLHGVPLPD
jgi:hypothetical protein